MIYQNSNMTPTPSGHISLFGLVFFSLKSPLEIVRKQSREKFAVLFLKPWSDVVKIPIYLTRAISNDLMFQPLKTWTIRWIPEKSLSWFLHFTHKRGQPFFLSEGKIESFGSVAKENKEFLQTNKQTNKQTERMNKMESRFFEPPREMKIGLKNRKFENSKVLWKNTYLSSGTWQEVRLLPEWQTVRTIFSLIVIKRGVTGPTKSPHTPKSGYWATRHIGDKDPCWQSTNPEWHLNLTNKEFNSQ